MFMVHLPCEPLRPFIESYWFLDPSEHTGVDLDELLFTDARADLVFTFETPFVRMRADGSKAAQQISAAYIDAQRRYPVRLRRSGKGGLIWVRFRFGGLAAFVRAPIHELSGHTVSIYDVFGPPALVLEEQLAASCHRTGLHPQTRSRGRHQTQTQTCAQARQKMQAALLDDFFLSHAAMPPGYQQAMHLIRMIERRRGIITVSRLSRSTGDSIRTIDRLFQRVVGLPPKFFARTVRFRHVHRALVAQPRIHWADIVAALDYFDESHLAKDVLSLTGMPPQAYRAFLSQKEGACLDALSSFYMTKDRRPA